MRILVAGSSGQVALSLAEAARVRKLDVVTFGRPAFDLTREADIIRVVADVKPNIVINAAAYTAVDQAENEPEAVYALNAIGAGWLAREAARADAPVVHISTDYVFPGSKASPYLESDATAPLGVYGGSKLQGERAVAAANPQHVIVRVAWVYSPFGRNFVRTMLRLAETHAEIGVVADQIGNPTYAPDIAEGLLDIAAKAAGQGAAERWGVFHMPASGEAVWADVAEAVFAEASARGAPAAHVRRITTADYPTRARRPANSRLDGSKLAAIYGVRLPDWRSGVQRCLRQLIVSEKAEMRGAMLPGRHGTRL